MYRNSFLYVANTYIAQNVHFKGSELNAGPLQISHMFERIPTDGPRQGNRFLVRNTGYTCLSSVFLYATKSDLTYMYMCKQSVQNQNIKFVVMRGRRREDGKELKFYWFSSALISTLSVAFWYSHIYTTLHHVNQRNYKTLAKHTPQAAPHPKRDRIASIRIRLPLSTCRRFAILLPTTCVFVRVDEPRSYFASAVPGQVW